MFSVFVELFVLNWSVNHRAMGLLHATAARWTPVIILHRVSTPASWSRKLETREVRPRCTGECTTFLTDNVARRPPVNHAGIQLFTSRGSRLSAMEIAWCRRDYSRSLGDHLETIPVALTSAESVGETVTACNSALSTAARIRLPSWNENSWHWFLANVRSIFAVARPSVVCL